MQSYRQIAEEKASARFEKHPNAEWVTIYIDRAYTFRRGPDGKAFLVSSRDMSGSTHERERFCCD